MGNYYFVNDILSDKPADLNNVKLVESSDKQKLLTYFEKVRSAPAVVVEYTVK